MGMQTQKNVPAPLQRVQLYRVVTDANQKELLPAREMGRLRRHWSSGLFVFVPTLLAVIYFYGFAANRYVSEVKFVVVNPQTAATSAVASLIQSTGSSAGATQDPDDAYAVKEFILSRDALSQLVAQDHLMEVFNRPQADIVWRYPGLRLWPSQEALYRHYLRFIDMQYDSDTGVATLNVQAFVPEDARRIATALVAHAEQLINRMNDRAQAEALRSALAEVEASKQSAYQALDKITAYRNREAVIDPKQASSAIFDTIAHLSSETADANVAVSQLIASSPLSPRIADLRSKIAALQDQIALERQKLGGADASLAPRIAEYERLSLDQQFSERTFISALGSLETARLDAERQRVFLNQVAAPNLPDYPVYPYRAIWVLSVFALSWIAWRLFGKLAEDARDHASA
jgi:capsular polysaccharide transport system permease protein